MASMEPYTCDRCGTEDFRNVDPPTILRQKRCATCVKLGDRSLLWYMREMRAATTDEQRAELRARFAAAKGNSWMARDRREA
jgi:hypothetical protein